MGVLMTVVQIILTTAFSFIAGCATIVLIAAVSLKTVGLL